MTAVEAGRSKVLNTQAWFAANQAKTGMHGKSAPAMLR